MFSQSTDNMGLTDIEMAQFDYDDPYYDERQYDVEYEVSNVQTVVIVMCKRSAMWDPYIAMW